METIIIDSTDSTTTEKIKDFLKELNVTFKTKSKKDKEKSYDPAFVKKILDRAENAKKGNTITIDPNDLWGSLGLK
jgi:ribose 5-phosphate isomerase RpiB